jgi:DNA-binding protein H-NS
MQLANTVTEKREVTLEILSNKNSIRNMFLELHMDDAEAIYNKITDVMDEKRKVYQAEAAERESKLTALKEIKAQLEAQGLSVEDLVSLVSHQPIGSLHSTKKARNVKAQPKFRFIYLKDGKKETYEGKIGGRKPDDFKSYLDETGKKLIDIVHPEDKEALEAELAAR